jgi:hypothetical protein
MKLNVHLKFDEDSHEHARNFIHLKMGLNLKNLDVLGKNEMLKMVE